MSKQSPEKASDKIVRNTFPKAKQKIKWLGKLSNIFILIFLIFPTFYFVVLIAITFAAYWKQLFSNWSSYRFFSEWYHFYQDAHAFHEVLLGIIGIFVGLYIAYFLDRLQGEKTQLLESKQDLIKNTIEELRDHVKPEVVKINTYKALIHEIGRVIEHASRIDGDLLIMNLSASFGYYLTYDCDTVLENEIVNEREPLDTPPNITHYNKVRISKLRRHHGHHDLRLRADGPAPQCAENPGDSKVSAPCKSFDGSLKLPA